MCGHWGCAGPGIGSIDMHRLRELAVISIFRGRDSTGVAQGLATKKTFRYTIEKKACDADMFLAHHAYHKDGNDRILNDFSCNFIIGHVRAATRGAVTDENAHPFDTGRYISAHNGTLRDKKYDDKEKTDSEMMFEDVEERGFYEVLRTLDKDSAYSIVSFDKQTKELVFATNGKRPLVYCYLKNRRVFFWASEKRQLDFIMNGISDASTVYKFTDDMIYKFRPENVCAGTHPLWDVRRITPEVPEKVETFRITDRRSTSVPTIPPMVTETKNQTNIIKIADKGRVLTSALVSNKLQEHNRRHKANMLIRKCVYCQAEMDLLEQYKGTEIDVGMYSCKQCDEMQTALSTHRLN